jgi:anti-sigma factor RsiW
MTKHGHLSGGLLMKMMDSELTGTEASSAADHMAQCGECKRQYEDLRRTSLLFESLVAAVPSGELSGERESLREKLEVRQHGKAPGQSPEKVMWRFGWGMAIAASLALGIIMSPKQTKTADKQFGVSQTGSFSNAIEVNGETFVALPYSNPDLPVSESRIVEMRVPVSALNDIGIVIEPVSARESGSDRSVLADVLIGTDGQPLGVHVLE